MRNKLASFLSLRSGYSTTTNGREITDWCDQIQVSNPETLRLADLTLNAEAHPVIFFATVVKDYVCLVMYKRWQRTNIANFFLLGARSGSLDRQNITQPWRRFEGGGSDAPQQINAITQDRLSSLRCFYQAGRTRNTRLDGWEVSTNSRSNWTVSKTPQDDHAFSWTWS